MGWTSGNITILIFGGGYTAFLALCIAVEIIVGHYNYALTFTAFFVLLTIFIVASLNGVIRPR